jgi:hypothetical protein
MLAEFHFMDGRRRPGGGGKACSRNRPQDCDRREQRTAGTASYDGISTKKTADKPSNIAASINITTNGILIANLFNTLYG